MHADLAKDIDAISRIGAVPVLLRVLCESTGMGLAAIVRLGAGGGTVCAVEDRIQTGLRPGERFELTTREYLSKWASDASVSSPMDPTPTDDHYLWVPIMLADGRYFGNLCAVDPHPAGAPKPWVLPMFHLFSGLIGLELGKELRRGRETAELLDERAANDLREQFIAILGHDLRNPLQAIAVIGGLLERGSTDPRMAAMASRIRASTRRMSALIDDTLDFARIRLGGGLGVELIETDAVESALTDAVQELKDGHPTRHITTHIAAKCRMRCDESRLQQLVSNLLSNALNHGYADSIVRFTAVADEHYLALEVWNDGEPIPPESIENLFLPFWRNRLEKKRAGLGLGLHICNQIVRAHHGQFTVTSKLKSGTKFTVRIPLGVKPASPISVSPP
jgi:signal transduction histidine kinase